MRRSLTVIIALSIYFPLIAQLSVSNQGGLISLKDGAFISIHGDYLSELNGSFDNEDTVFLFGDWTNNAGNTGFNEPLEGTVVFTGDTQRINGSDITHYNNLDHRATGVKFGDLNVGVDGIMQLNDREFNMDINVVEVTNTALAAVKNDGDGFVSSLENGGLARHTAMNDSYFFPVGSSLGTLRYRPVEMTPNSGAANIYKVRMANVDATLESFDRAVREPTICDINPFFYHRIFRTQGNDPADIKISFDEAVDGTYEDIVHWQHIPQWEDVGMENYVPGGGNLFSTLEINDWDDFTRSPFALATSSMRFDINNDQEVVCKGDTIQLYVNEEFISYEYFVNGVPEQDSALNVFVISTLQDGDSIMVIAQDTNCIAYANPIKLTVFDNPVAYAGEDTTVYIGADVQLDGTTAGGVYYTWSPDSSLDFPNSPDPLATVYETTTYTLLVENTWGCEGRDTVVVYVDREIDPREVLFIPNAITPNGDAVNERWNIRHLDLFLDHEIVILNRWGDVIYQASPYSIPWDGTYNGTPVPDGTYYYLIKLKDINKVLNGPLTVIR